MLVTGCWLGGCPQSSEKPTKLATLSRLRMDFELDGSKDQNSGLRASTTIPPQVRAFRHVKIPHVHFFGLADIAWLSGIASVSGLLATRGVGSFPTSSCELPWPPSSWRVSFNAIFTTGFGSPGTYPSSFATLRRGLRCGPAGHHPRGLSKLCTSWGFVAPDWRSFRRTWVRIGRPGSSSRTARLSPLESPSFMDAAFSSQPPRFGVPG